MAKYTENTTIFNYNWEQVTQGFWRRYPNPWSSHVLTEDTLQREVRPDGKLYSKRILSKTNRVPKWGERFFKAKSVFIVEESIVDPCGKTLTTLTRNIGFNTIMVRIGYRFYCQWIANYRFYDLVILVSSRVSSRKLYTKSTDRVERSHIVQLGLTRKCLDLQAQYVRLAVTGLRRIVIRR